MKFQEIPKLIYLEIDSGCARDAPGEIQWVNPVQLVQNCGERGCIVRAGRGADVKIDSVNYACRIFEAAKLDRFWLRLRRT